MSGIVYRSHAGRLRLVEGLPLRLGVFLIALVTGAMLPEWLCAAQGTPKEGTAEKQAETPIQEFKEEERTDALEEVMDSEHWEFFKTLGLEIDLGKIGIGKFRITKFMVMELLAALLIIAIYVPLARRLRDGEPPRGGLVNAFEVLLTFIRDEVAKPGIGEHDADRFVPFLWTMFLFILFNNLIGMVPFGASPTSNIFVTGALAVCVFFAIHGSAIAKLGFWHYLGTFWPEMEVPFGLGYVLKPLVCVLEMNGVLVRNGVLAIRLFANLFAGHMVSGTILLFIVLAAKTGFGLWLTITVSSVLGVVAMSLLDLFIAFLQAYIFVFLSALFIGMAVHPQH